MWGALWCNSVDWVEWTLALIDDSTVRSESVVVVGSTGGVGDCAVVILVVVVRSVLLLVDTRVVSTVVRSDSDWFPWVRRLDESGASIMVLIFKMVYY